MKGRNAYWRLTDAQHLDQTIDALSAAISAAARPSCDG
jgi:hypothetical protein